MAVDVLVEAVIDRPLTEVAGYVGDPSNAPQWYSLNIASVEWQTPPPIAVGSRIAFVARFLGRDLAYTYEVVELVPGRRLVMRTSQGPFPMETTYEWDEIEQGARRSACASACSHQGSAGSPPRPWPLRCEGARARTWPA